MPRSCHVTGNVVNAKIVSFSREVDVLPGDVNDDGVVDARDASIERNQIVGIAPPTVFGDSTVNNTDHNLVRSRNKSKLP